MTDRRPTGGARRAEPASRSPVARIGQVVLPVAILALVATLVVFGDAIFDGGAEPQEPDQGTTASGPIGGQEDEEAQSKVVEVATTVLDTWSRPGAAYAGWWRRLEPLLTPGGREAYAATDPALVPDLDEIEVDEVVLHRPGVTATVYFTTSKGRFGVDLSRQAPDAEWLANRVVFP
ncbi:MAG: hypothetical protein M3237_02670, partial [Actinomycetota bacterium]|nr:hypothetical protein [Actinomycetota bacterium]